MMKTAKIILALSLLLGYAQLTHAQVKIGDRPLDIGNDRLLEMERAGDLFIVTDGLEIGRTNSNLDNVPGTDAMMLKLYGYGLGQFTGTQDFFLGTNTNGEVLEFPLTLNLETNSTTATISLFNGTNTFGNVDLTTLDSVFTTNTQLIDSLQSIRNVLDDVSNAVDSDLDTIQTNELIDEIALLDNGLGTGEQTLIRFYENRFVTDDLLRDSSEYDLTFGLASDVELRDTAKVLRDHIFYKIDGTLDEDRFVTGDNNSLTFTGIDSFNINSTNTTLTATGNTTISSDGPVAITSVNDNVVIDASTDSISMIGSIRFDEYPSKPVETTFDNILGLDADGNVINISAGTILGTEEDSVIYRHNGELSSERTMNMNLHNLFFVSDDLQDTTVIANNGRVAVGTGSFTPNSAGPNPSDVKLEVNGDILARRVHSSSDKRFKKNIKTIDSAMDKVMALNGVTYDWRTEEFKNRNFPNTKQVGFIAQNVESVLPEVVQTYGDGYKAVDYSKVTALLTEAIKEQQLQIEAQTQLIQTQKTALASLVKEIETLGSKLTQKAEALGVDIDQVSTDDE